MLVPEHQDAWINLLHGYISSAAAALHAGGVHIERGWLDPSGPRDATIVYTVSGTTRALVWDEVTGWRNGRYEAGQPGVRTTLSDVSYLGGGVLLSTAELASRLPAGLSGPRIPYRSITDRDGLDEALAGWKLN